MPSPKDPLQILFVDPHLVIVSKPSGLLVHRGWANDADVALFRVRDQLGQYVYPVHRLDRGTSGVLLFARTSEAASRLNRRFQDGEVEKRYWALVRGVPPETGVIDYPLPKEEAGSLRVPAVTHFRRIAASSVDRCSLVEAIPQTGRLHQIRLHLRHLNHPLIGDVKHGNGEINRRYRALYQLHRLALHAHRICFQHPFSAETVSISAPLPEEFASALSKLELRVPAEAHAP